MQYNKTMTHQMCVQCDYPPVSSAIIWARQVRIYSMHSVHTHSSVCFILCMIALVLDQIYIHCSEVTIMCGCLCVCVSLLPDRPTVADLPAEG